MSLDRMFNPKSIAVIGASETKGTVGFDLFKNIAFSAYKGKVFPVNINKSTIQGKKAYLQISDIKDDIDLAIIATPAFTVHGVVESCAQKGIKNLIIISSGFSEVGKVGQKMTEDILEIAKKNNIRIIGPNCLGFLNPYISLNASFAVQNATKGDIAFVSQSGALCTAILDWSNQNKIGFSNFVSIGSMADIGFYDLLKYFKNDIKTKSILIYMETLTDASSFIKTAQEIVINKPIFVLKVGRSKEGASAAKSHTGSLTGDDAIFDAAFDRAGIVRLEAMDDLYATAKLLSKQGSKIGESLTVITNAGGPGVIATDSIIGKGGKLTKISKSVVKKLNDVLPSSWSHGNPIDIIGDADPERYINTIDVCLKDKYIKSILVLLTPQSMTMPSLVAKGISKLYLNNKNKNLFVSFLGGTDVEKGRNLLEESGVPTFDTPSQAISAYSSLLKYFKLKNELSKKIKLEKISFKKNLKENRNIIENIKNQKRNSFTEEEAKIFLKNYNIPITKHVVAFSKKEAGLLAEKIGFPVVMKVSSPDILHKVDAGGVIVGVKNKNEAELFFDKIINSSKKYNKNAKIDGVLIEEMVNKKFELLIGCKKDPIFGQVLVFGAGGTYVEVINDTAMELLPLNDYLVDRIIQKTKIYKPLKGYRGQDGININELKNVIIKFSQLITDFPEIKEFDINPYCVDKKGGLVLDAKILI